MTTVVGAGLKVVCSREELAAELAVVGRGVSTRTAVQILSGVLLRADGGKLELAATDMELSIRTSIEDAQVEGEGAVVVPGQLLVGVDGTWLTTRRIEGQFPKFDELRPKEFAHEVAVPREELLEVVRRTAVMAHRNSPLRLRFAEGELTLSAQTQDVGESKE